MAYYKSFWAERPFRGQDLEMGEGYSFILGREHQVANMPYYFNLIAITHKENYTGQLRTYDGEKGGNVRNENKISNHDNFFNLWSPETQYFILELKNKALASSALKK